LLQWESQGEEDLHLVDSIELNTKHYVDILSKAVDNTMPQPSTDVK
jgi:DNA replication licensing factor MCM7